VEPTSYELVFTTYYDEETSGDADCVVHVDATTVTSAPLALLGTTGELVSARSILLSMSSLIKRSEYRRRARKAAEELPTLGEPEDRLAATTAQPSVYAAIVHANPPELTPVVEEHALLRLYSGRPSETHGTERSLMPGLAKDYPTDASVASAILADQIPDDTSCEVAMAYARVR
jgi:hypothetical protein